MKFLKRLKSSNFWVSMISAVVLILQAVFNVEIKTEYLSQIIMAMLGLLVMSGIVSDSSSDEVTVKQDLDVDGIMKNIGNILTQVTATFQNDVLGVITQFESIKNGLTTNKADKKSNPSIVESVETKTEQKQQIETVVQNVEVVESLNTLDATINNADNVEKTEVVDKIEEIKTIEVQPEQNSSLNVL